MYFEIMKNYISSLSKDRDTSISSEYLDISSDYLLKILSNINMIILFGSNYESNIIQHNNSILTATTLKFYLVAQTTRPVACDRH